MTPGALRGEVRLSLQTRHAQRLVAGRSRRADRPAIRGLLGFGERTRALWQAAQEDDPYADWYLVKIEARLRRSSGDLRALKVQVGDIAGRSGLEWTAGESTAPVRIQLRFATPYAYRGAHLLAEYDRLARLALTSRFLGILEPSRAASFLRQGGRAVRSAFDSVNGYRRFDIDRDAVMAGTPAALRARVAMGELPADILAEERLAELRPRRMRARMLEDDLEPLGPASTDDEGGAGSEIPGDLVDALRLTDAKS
jgi:integrating conjugative element protein (TIGR03761 family)